MNCQMLNIITLFLFNTSYILFDSILCGCLCLKSMFLFILETNVVNHVLVSFLCFYFLTTLDSKVHGFAALHCFCRYISVLRLLFYVVASNSLQSFKYNYVFQNLVNASS